ncbi:hypothetical protein ACHAXT_001658 [Thalassiosira profunda]
MTYDMNAILLRLLGPVACLVALLAWGGLLFGDVRRAIRFDLPLGRSHEVNRDDRSWVDADCFEPISHPIIGRRTNPTGTKKTIINVGFPKVGSLTLYEFLKSSPVINASHFWPCGGKDVYGKPLPCAACIKSSIERGLPPLKTCGDFGAYTQLDNTPFKRDNITNGTCTFPQISYLNEMYEEAPNAIFVLPFRNVSKWIRSLGSFNSMRRRFTKFCEWPQYNFTKDAGKEDRDFERLYCQHVKHIRRFVVERPTLTLVEYAIDQKDAGRYLSSVIPHLNGSNYGHANSQNTKKKERNDTDTQ